MRLLAAIFLMLASCVAVYAAEGTVQLLAPNVKRWGIKEISLKSEREYANPYADVQINGFPIRQHGTSHRRLL